MNSPKTPRRRQLGWKGALSAVSLIVLLVTPNPSLPQRNRGKSWASYYPLAKGNSWTYSVIGESGEREPKPVVWKVLNVSSDTKGQTFAVWQIPADADDTGMQLQFTKEGLRELSGDFFLLRFPLDKDSTWQLIAHDRVFSVLSEGERCAIGKLTFNSCAVIRDDDREAKLRTLTTYAFGVGPVRYEYHKMVHGDFERDATQILNIVSYSVKPSAGGALDRNHQKTNE